MVMFRSFITFRVAHVSTVMAAYKHDFANRATVTRFLFDGQRKCENFYNIIEYMKFVEDLLALNTL